MYIVEITEDKFDCLYDNAEKMLRYGGKLMSCLDEMKQDSDRYDERNRMPDYRGGGRRGMREHDDYESMRRREGRDRVERDYRGRDEEY